MGPRLVFGDTVGYAPTTQAGAVWSDSRHLTLETFHVEGMQRVVYGGANVKISRTHEPFQIDRQDSEVSPQRLVAPVGDLRIIGDGWFTFTPDAFFAPQPRRVTDFMDPEAEGIRAVLTPYERPVPLGDGWYRASVRFKLEPSANNVRLALSAPNLLTRAGAVDIRRFRLTYRRQPLTLSEWWRVVRQEAGNAWRRVKE